MTNRMIVQKNQLNHNYNNDFDYDNETSVLTNIHDPQDTIETFQPITVGIHVQEMKGFRKELILSILSSHAFDEVSCFEEGLIEQETEEEKKEMNEKKEKKEVSEKKEKKEKNLKREKKRKEEKVEKRRKVE